MAFIETLHRLFMEASMGLTVEETCVAYKLIDKMLVLYRKHEEIPAKDVDIPPMEVNSDKKNNLGSLWNNVGSTFIWPKTSGEPSLKLPSSSTKEVRNSQMLTDDDKESSTVTEEVGTPMELCDTEKTLSPVLEQHVRIVVPVLEEGEIPPTSPSASEEDIIIISSSISTTPPSVPNAPQKNQMTYQQKMAAALKRSAERAKVKTMEVYFTNRLLKSQFCRAEPGYMRWEKFLWRGESGQNVICDTTKEAIDVMNAGGNAFFFGPKKRCPRNAFITEEKMKMKMRFDAVAQHMAGKSFVPRCTTEALMKKKTTTPTVLRRSTRVPAKSSSAPQPDPCVGGLSQSRSFNVFPWSSLDFYPILNSAIAPPRSQDVPERSVLNQSLSVPPMSLPVPPKSLPVPPLPVPPLSVPFPPKSPSLDQSLPLNQSLSVNQSPSVPSQTLPVPPKSLSIPLQSLPHNKSLPLNQSLPVNQSPSVPSQTFPVPPNSLSIPLQSLPHNKSLPLNQPLSVPPKSLPVPTPSSNVANISLPLPPPAVTKTVKQEVPSFSVPDVKFNTTTVSPHSHQSLPKDQPLPPTVEPTPKKTVKQEVVDPIPDNSVPNPTPSSNVKKEVNTQ